MGKKEFTDDIVANIQFDPSIGIQNYKNFTKIIEENIENYIPLVINSKRSAPFLDYEISKSG